MLGSSSTTLLVLSLILSCLSVTASPTPASVAIAYRKAARSRILGDSLNQRLQAKWPILSSGPAFRIQVPSQSPASPIRGNFFIAPTSVTGQPETITTSDPHTATQYRLTIDGRLQLVAQPGFDATVLDGNSQSAVHFVDSTETPNSSQGNFLTCAVSSAQNSVLSCTDGFTTRSLGFTEGGGLALLFGGLAVQANYV